jgi:ElaB/YqjD/DUF883 family membrane-anchored ribosome-binding protein
MNTNGPDQQSGSENGFKKLSEVADDRLSSSGASEESAVGADLSTNLKSVGVDTDKIAEAANERVSGLQQMLEDEVRARPLQTLGWAAAAGLVLGFMAAR